MASDSETSTADLSKIRKDYLKLSKAKLTKECKAVHLDPYGSKAVLVDLLLKNHRKKLNASKSPDLSPSKRHTKHHRQMISSSPRVRHTQPHHSYKSRDRLPPLSPRKGMKPNAYIQRSLYQRRKRTKSTYLMNSKPLKLMNRNAKDRKTRRSSMDELQRAVIKDKKRLLLMSKMDLIKECKLQNVSITGLRNRNDIINKMINIEQLFKEKHKLHAQKAKARGKKNKKHGLRRTKSEDVVIPKPKKETIINVIKETANDDDNHDTKSKCDDEIDTSLWLNSDCDFRECVARKRLILSLKEYEEKYETSEDDRSESEQMNEFMKQHQYLVSDWHHILQIHFECSQAENDSNFNLLYENMKKHHLLCDIASCSYYIRNNQNRETLNGSDEEIDLKHQFMRDLLDSIHCFLVHSFDTGFRMRNVRKNTFDNAKDLKIDSKSLYLDEEMEGNAQYIDMKRQEMRQIRGMNDSNKHNRFCGCINRMSTNSSHTYAQPQCTCDADMDGASCNTWNEYTNIKHMEFMNDCTTEQLISVLNDYCFVQMSRSSDNDILNDYKDTITQYFEQNNWNGTHLSEMDERTFVETLTLQCDSNNKMKYSLAELYHLFEFKSNKISQSMSIATCTHDEILFIVRDLLHKNELLKPYKKQIISFFKQRTITGEILSKMKRKRFCNELIQHVKPNSDTKLNHSLVLFHKELMNLDVTEIEFDCEQKSNEFQFEFNNKRKTAPYCTIGQKLFYWPHYAHDECFVTAQYSNLKEEIFALHDNGKDIWKMAHNKGTMLLNTSVVLKSYACLTDKWMDLYGVDKGSKLQISHLLSVILYTDYPSLSSAFADSFMSVSDNTKFAHWSRFLRETVECFDTKNAHETDVFYYGMCDKYVFNSFLTRVYGVSSMSTQLSVAQMYCNASAGIIVEFRCTNNTYFNATLLGNHCSEFEHVFIGGYRSLRIQNIDDCLLHYNYSLFLHALTVFLAFINGKDISKTTCVTSTDYMIINALCRHKANIKRNPFPPYINDIFAAFCDCVEEITIDLKHLDESYVGLKTMFTHKAAIKAKVDCIKPRLTLPLSSAIDAPCSRRPRSHSFSFGSQVSFDVIRSDYLFKIVGESMCRIGVVSAMEGIGYDVVRGVPKLLFVYKMNGNIDAQLKKELEANIERKFEKEFDLIFIQNPLIDRHFYIDYLVQILEYFVDDSNWNSRSISLGSAAAAAASNFISILKWKLQLMMRRDATAATLALALAPQMKQYFSNKMRISIDIDKWNKCKQINANLMHHKCKYLVQFNLVSSVFTNCCQIVLTSYRGENIIISRYYLQQLLKIITNINTNKWCANLTQIVIKTKARNAINVQCTEHELQTLKHRFVKNKWKIQIKKSSNNHQQDQETQFDIQRIGS
eukprot:230248_1